MRIWVCLLALMAMTSLASAAGLDGRTVILVVAEHRQNDPVLAPIEAELTRLRSQLGFSAQDMPLVFMGFADSDTERAYFDRLGFKAEDAPIICVAEWGNPARFGPKKVLGAAIARRAQSEHSAAVVNAYLSQMGFENRLPEPPSFTLGSSPEGDPVVDDTPGKLEIGNVRFEVGGKTMFTTNVGVRVRNLEQRTLHDVKVRFFARLPQNPNWTLIDEQSIGKILAGNSVVRDHLADSRNLGLVGPDGLPLPCRYRIEVEHLAQTISKEGDFVPANYVNP